MSVDALAKPLQELYEATKERVEVEKKIEPERDLRRLATLAPKPKRFHPTYGPINPHIIAEVKLASPSEGDIALGVDPVDIATQYLKSGASAISVLTEPSKFKGSKEFLRRIRAAHPEAQLLMKDFVIDWYQLLQAKVYGANAVLLIVDFIDRELLTELYLQTGWLGLTPLLEVHDEDQLNFALNLKAHPANDPVIGVNNRDLRTMKVSLETGVRLGELLKRDHRARYLDLVAESGIKDGHDIDRLNRVGFQAFLIGTELMRSGDISEAMERMRREWSGSDKVQ